MRLPRKLKKGCRTLNGNPRTKWQRKGRLHIAKVLNDVVNTACAAAVGMDLLRQAAERINPVTFPSGGIVVPPPPKVGVAQMPNGEMVLNREQDAGDDNTGGSTTNPSTGGGGIDTSGDMEG